jgi:hypothetical protein
MRNKIIDLRVLNHYRVWSRFNHDVSGEIDFSDKPRAGVYPPTRDYEFFRRARINGDGQLAWDEQLDFSADPLWLKINEARRVRLERNQCL